MYDQLGFLGSFSYPARISSQPIFADESCTNTTFASSRARFCPRTLGWAPKRLWLRAIQAQSPLALLSWAWNVCWLHHWPESSISAWYLHSRNAFLSSFRWLDLRVDAADVVYQYLLRRTAWEKRLRTFHLSRFQGNELPVWHWRPGDLAPGVSMWALLLNYYHSLEMFKNKIK